MTVLGLGCGGEPGNSGDGSDSASSKEGSSTASGTSESGGTPTDTTGSTSATQGTGTTGPSGSGSSSPADTSTGEATDSDASSGDTDGPPTDFGPGSYVRAVDGMDSNPGTADAPLRTVRAGVAAAAEQDLAVVYVAQGAYLASYDDGLDLVMVDGISIYGGYDESDWDVRDPEQFASLLDDSASSSGNALITPSRAVTFPQETGPETRLDGFTVVGGVGGAIGGVVFEGGAGVLSHSTVLASGGQLGVGVVILGGEPTLESNRILADNLGTSVRGVYCEFAAPELHRNDIRATASSNTRGLVLNECDASVRHNVIVSGEPNSSFQGNAVAVQISNAFPTVASNTLVAFPHVGLASSAGVHVELLGSRTQALIDNNNFVQVDGDTRCILASDITHLEPGFHNNNVMCDVIYARTGPGGSPLDAVSEVEAEFPDASGNVRLSPAFVNAAEGDWSLPTDGSTPCGVARGGLTQGNDEDIDGLTRTRPWSIGAYEVDGACL